MNTKELLPLRLLLNKIADILKEHRPDHEKIQKIIHEMTSENLEKTNQIITILKTD